MEAPAKWYAAIYEAPKKNLVATDVWYIAPADQKLQGLVRDRLGWVTTVTTKPPIGQNAKALDAIVVNNPEFWPVAKELFEAAPSGTYIGNSSPAMVDYLRRIKQEVDPK